MGDLHLTSIIGLLLVVGGTLVAVGGVAGFWVGRAASDPGGVQARVTVRELQGTIRDNRAQLGAVRDGVSRVRQDPRTHPHTQLELDRVLELLTQRARR